MRCPPCIISMRIAEEERTRFRLWLPLFLLWPLLLPLLALTLLATLLADLFSLVSGHRPGYTRFICGVLGIVGETRGTQVSIQDKGNTNRTVAFTIR